MKALNLFFLTLLTAIAGCGNPDMKQFSSDASNNAVGSQYIVESELEGALPVGEARASVEDQQAVTLVGTIGGSSEPFVDGLAAFSIVDPTVPYCPPEEGCPTPWDYCCTQDQVKDNIATVKIVDDAGKPVTADARKLLGVKELSTVVVQGKAQRDEQGNLTIVARKVYVKQD